MKSLKFLFALLLLVLISTFANAGPFRRGCSGGSCGGGSCGGGGDQSASFNQPSYAAVSYGQPNSVCGPCAYAGVPCSPANCAAACTAGCSTGCPTVQLSGKTYRVVNGQLYDCTGTTCVPATAPAIATAKPVTEGDHVQHPANPFGLFPAGTGTVEKEIPLNKGGKVYTVKCDKTGKTLPVAFDATEIWTH